MCGNHCTPKYIIIFISVWRMKINWSIIWKVQLSDDLINQHLLKVKDMIFNQNISRTTMWLCIRIAAIKRIFGDKMLNKSYWKIHKNLGLGPSGNKQIYCLILFGWGVDIGL